MEKVLGDFEQLVLLSLMRLTQQSRQGSEPYGVSICDDITARTGRDVSLGAVYKTLERLEDKGLVSGLFGEPTAERGGRRKKHFKLMAQGQRALKQSMAALRNMTEGLEAELKS